MKPLSERLKTFSASQFIDWLCLACVDVREVHTPYDAQEEINKIREALTERLSTLQQQLTATTNSLTNAREALKSAGIEADAVQAGVVELKDKLRIKQNHIKLRDTYIEELEQRAEAAEAKVKELEQEQAEHDDQIATLQGKFDLALSGMRSKTERCEKAEMKLAELKNQEPIGRVDRGAVTDSNEYPDARVVCLHEHVGWEAFQDGTELFLRPATAIDLNSVRADTERMNYLVGKVVNVRTPLPYGSHNIFWSQCITDDSDPSYETDLREQIDAQLRAGNAGKDGV